MNKKKINLLLQKNKKTKEDKEQTKEVITEESAGGGMVKVIKLKNGLQYQDVDMGQGPPVKNGKTVRVRYKGMLSNGEVFDSNMPKGRPFVFELGASDVIQGWNVGIQGMKVGGRRNLLIPPHLGYGKKGSPPAIPPNASLIFEIHIVSMR